MAEPDTDDDHLAYLAAQGVSALHRHLCRDHGWRATETVTTMVAMVDDHAEKHGENRVASQLRVKAQEKRQVMEQADLETVCHRVEDKLNEVYGQNFGPANDGAENEYYVVLASGTLVSITVQLA